MKLSEIRKLKKAAAAVLVAGLCLLTISGCGSTEQQEEVVVVKKQDEEIVSEQMVAEDEGEPNNASERVQVQEIVQKPQDNIVQMQELQNKGNETKVEEIRKLVEENRDEMGKLASSCMGYSNGNFYISDAQIKEMCGQYADILEQYRSYFPDKGENWYYLADFYYVLGEYELCMETRKQLYELTGLEWYEPGECSESIEINEYDYSDNFICYTDEYGRCILHTGEAKDGMETRTYETKYEYGENGKLIQKKTNNIYQEEERVENYVETFEYDSKGRVSKIVRDCQITEGESPDWFNESTFVYDENGFTEHFQGQNTSGASSQYDQDYELDEYGNATRIG